MSDVLIARRSGLSFEWQLDLGQRLGMVPPVLMFLGLVLTGTSGASTPARAAWPYFTVAAGAIRHVRKRPAWSERAERIHASCAALRRRYRGALIDTFSSRMTDREKVQRPPRETVSSVVS